MGAFITAGKNITDNTGIGIGGTGGNVFNPAAGQAKVLRSNFIAGNCTVLYLVDPGFTQQGNLIQAVHSMYEQPPGIS
ncbi:hypothetical protein SDC9_212555 [bioreactor metagenome]|uniref:Uncharacterized protein n=1 Tax=bioreactor metagenome TaxID=1076179 RepID=A0A645JMA1_9ZZZZ